MKLVSTIAVLASLLAIPAGAQQNDACTEFNQLVAKTYNFDALKLTDDEKLAKEGELDRFWTTVQAKKKEYLPCLRAAVADEKSNAFFRYNGSNLLVELDPSLDSKKLQVEIYTQTDLDIVGTQRWVSTLTQRGIDGLDVSQAALRWLSDPEAVYDLPEHGGFEVGPFDGALFLYGSMDEAITTPALLKILEQENHPLREAALALLMRQATPQAIEAMKQVKMTGISPQLQEAVTAMLKEREFIEPRAKPETTRAEFIQAFNAILKGDTSKFSKLVREVPDGERDAVAVLLPEDLPLVRKVRRQFVSGGTPHSISYYDEFTSIIMMLVLKSENSPQ